MSINWNKYLRYKDGKLYWKERRRKNRKDFQTKVWNTKYAGTEAGCVGVYGYVLLNVESKTRRRARVVWEMHNGNIPKGKEVDHINFNRSDDRIENLQLLTSQENQSRKSQKHMFVNGENYGNSR